MSSFPKKKVYNITNIAYLARLKLSPNDIKKMENDLVRILDFVNQLQDVDVKGVSPMTSISSRNLVMRHDTVSDGNIQKEVLSNAPSINDGYFVVPKVIES